jgi:hypothetical protein
VQTLCYFIFPTVYAIFLTSYLSVIVWLVWRSTRLAWFHPDATPLQRTLCRTALLFYLGGSALWVFENAVCGVHGEGGGGWPLQWAHLHALWHLGACMGTYHFIEFNAVRRNLAHES